MGIKLKCKRVKINGPSDKWENTHCSQSCYCRHIHTSHIHLKEDKNMHVQTQVNRTFVLLSAKQFRQSEVNLCLQHKQCRMGVQ